MKNPKLIWAGAGAAILAVLGGLIAWRGLPCGASTCGLGGWLYDFQTLVGGLLAFAAGAFVLLAARTQFKWEKSKRDDDARERALGVRRDQHTIMHATQFEYVQRAKELENLIDSLSADTDRALAMDPQGAEGASGPIRARASRQLRESIERCRAFCASTYRELTKLETSDHVQHRLSLIGLEAVLLEIEIFLHAIESLGGPGAGVLARLKGDLPTLKLKLSGAIDFLPTKENPTPFAVPDI